VSNKPSLNASAFPEGLSGPLPRRRLLLRRWAARLLWISLGLLLAAGMGHELKTSALQARLFSAWAARMTYRVMPGASPLTAFPQSGPFDRLRGYADLGRFEARLRERGFEIVRQARVSENLARAVAWGISPPYREPVVAALSIRGADGSLLYDARRPDRFFESFDEVPPLIAKTLVFMENRELLDPFDPRTNPAIEWKRLAKAGLVFAGGKLGLPLPTEGGSTLATQLEKFRHSPGGRTPSPLEKLRQVTSASLQAYRDGMDTRPARHEIVADYLDTMPLAAAPGYGELYGLGEGLYAWFGLSLAEVRAGLGSDRLEVRAPAYKHVLTLLAAVRAPTFYLIRSRDALRERVDNYTRLLRDAGIIEPELARAVMETPVRFLPHAPIALPPSFVRHKATTALRTQLVDLLDVPSLYDLNRLDLSVDSTIDPDLQDTVIDLFHHLADRGFVAAHGLNQKYLLEGEDPSRVVYGMMLFERTPQGNLLRVQADTLDQPFDVNQGVKMELGSTAKARTLAHYLEIVAQLHRELSGLPAAELRRLERQARDPITKWAAGTLAVRGAIGLEELLEASLDRRYSASPGETFFTGGGRHTFHNFDRDDNGRVMPVREALRRSTNLVFIRLIRDLVRFHRARLPYDVDAVLHDLADPTRKKMLEEIADGEAREALRHAYRRYRSLALAAIVQRLLGRRAGAPRQLAMLYYAWHRGADGQPLSAWLAQHGAAVSPNQVARLQRAYDNPRLNVSDFGYLLSRHPLDVWVAGEMAREPGLSWDDVLARSAGARRTASAWLFKTRNRRAQDLRLRIRVEEDAFARMTPYWQRLGFPFERLEPTYATAIGSSSDRPAALAELMGIILNDGVRRQPIRLTELRFAAGTPYESVFRPGVREERVMEPEVARTLREGLASVVSSGTARRLSGAFATRDGKPVIAGGKTGSGDNRYRTFSRSGAETSSRPINRTAAFVFYIGDRYYGVLTAFVPGRASGRYGFTSALPVTILKLLAPEIDARL
jgi:membrane peptidoglycan carboxypeptidase